MKRIYATALPAICLWAFAVSDARSQCSPSQIVSFYDITASAGARYRIVYAGNCSGPGLSPVEEIFGGQAQVGVTAVGTVGAGCLASNIEGNSDGGYEIYQVAGVDINAAVTALQPGGSGGAGGAGTFSGEANGASAGVAGRVSNLGVSYADQSGFPQVTSGQLMSCVASTQVFDVTVPEGTPDCVGVDIQLTGAVNGIDWRYVSMCELPEWATLGASVASGQFVGVRVHVVGIYSGTNQVHQFSRSGELSLSADGVILGLGDFSSASSSPNSGNSTCPESSALSRLGWSNSSGQAVDDVIVFPFAPATVVVYMNVYFSHPSCAQEELPVFVHCIGDFNGDGGVDGSDLADFMAAWAAGDMSADVNGDGGVDGADLEWFLSHWEAGC